ncbi:hypothetical protein F7725_023802 [Dissostichus mawsoni]|uniref:Uncharacterized protein n=1 Tax=Dissostichus mawsoni TaxID=36200 RepID=A0A7J5XYA4_DISMA|nr:hypothetical protein F7725_023802 [Dissostichus mawsoni]
MSLHMCNKLFHTYKTRRVVIPHSFGVTIRLKQWIGCNNLILNTEASLRWVIMAMSSILSYLGGFNGKTSLLSPPSPRTGNYPVFDSGFATIFLEDVAFKYSSLTSDT